MNSLLIRSVFLLSALTLVTPSHAKTCDEQRASVRNRLQNEEMALHETLERLLRVDGGNAYAQIQALAALETSKNQQIATIEASLRTLEGDKRTEALKRLDDLSAEMGMAYQKRMKSMRDYIKNNNALLATTIRQVTADGNFDVFIYKDLVLVTKNLARDDDKRQSISLVFSPLNTKMTRTYVEINSQRQDPAYYGEPADYALDHLPASCLNIGETADTSHAAYRDYLRKHGALLIDSVPPTNVEELPLNPAGQQVGN